MATSDVWVYPVAAYPATAGGALRALAPKPIIGINRNRNRKDHVSVPHATADALGGNTVVEGVEVSEVQVPHVEKDLELDHNELGTLKYIATQGGIEAELKVTTEGIKEDLAISSQTVSRRLRRLEDLDMIHRKRVADGQLITVTETGVDLLKREYDIYREIFDLDVELHGTVTTGLGEGEGFVSLSGYARQFRNKLGYEPFPGTLNVSLDERSQMVRKYLAAIDSIVIDGWEDDGRDFGAVHCYPVTVESGELATETAHLVVPERTSHGDEEVEIIAPDELRSSLDLDDGDEVTIRVD